MPSSAARASASSPVGSGAKVSGPPPVKPGVISYPKPGPSVTKPASDGKCRRKSRTRASAYSQRWARRDSSEGQVAGSVRAVAEVAEHADPHSLGRQLLDHGPEALGLLLHPGGQLRGRAADPFVELGGCPEGGRYQAPAAGRGEVAADEPPIGSAAVGLRLRVGALVVEVGPDEHEVADAAGDQLVLDAFVLEEVEGREDEGQGAQPRHGVLQGVVCVGQELRGVPVTIPKYRGDRPRGSGKQHRGPCGIAGVPTPESEHWRRSVTRGLRAAGQRLSWTNPLLQLLHPHHLTVSTNARGHTCLHGRGPFAPFRRPHQGVRQGRPQRRKARRVHSRTGAERRYLPHRVRRRRGDAHPVSGAVRLAATGASLSSTPCRSSTPRSAGSRGAPSTRSAPPGISSAVRSLSATATTSAGSRRSGSSPITWRGRRTRRPWGSRWRRCCPRKGR